MSSENSETRDRILATTVRLLEEHGGRGVRMSDIAKATGISRQAVYLHFSSRADLLTAAILFKGDQLDIAGRLAPSRGAKSGSERLALYIEMWGNFLPEIYGVAKALMVAQDSDDAAAAAGRDRMVAMRDGCRAAIEALEGDGELATGWTRDTAIDALWTMLLVPNWENLTGECGWTNDQYIERMTMMAKRMFVA